jgi:hypothetical protein
LMLSRQASRTFVLVTFSSRGDVILQG